MYKWYLPTLGEILAVSESAQTAERSGFEAQRRVRAEREWCGAIAALNSLLQSRSVATPDGLAASANSANLEETASLKREEQGLVLSGPLPVLDQPNLVSSFSTWTFTTEPMGALSLMPFQLLPAAGKVTQSRPTSSTLPLLPNDPLAAEQFCLVLTSEFSLVMVLGEDADAKPAFLFSFEPEVVWQSWRSLQSRLLLTNPQSFEHLDTLVKQFLPKPPDYRLVMQFSQLMLAHLPEPLDWEMGGDRAGVPIRQVSYTLSSANQSSTSQGQNDNLTVGTKPNTRHPLSKPNQPLKIATKGRPYDSSLEKLAQAKLGSDAELLQAIAHEVRTPLTTIRTLTRLLLKRKDLSPDAVKRLEVIDRECTEQIDRFSLIFRAVELETSAVKHPLSPLAAISLTQVFQDNVPRWQKQASQRGLTLEVILPQKLPLVVSDPTMLNQVLTGLMDQITHSLPSGSHIQVRVMLAGHQLKLQLQSQPKDDVESSNGRGSRKTVQSSFATGLKSVGRLLMFQPETGSLSLNMSVTKNLFQALGGKLIVRQRPEQGEVLTIFLPLETKRLEE
ncbi:HAMP domain-containing sensor histidine kinase [Leptolyngbya sp. FACHB-671]|uniref:sensor histidine kinase n=1 Tax=Leptolyngbya sp. FACHB-671 TaxID=2692812 RepID=UPI0032209A7F